MRKLGRKTAQRKAMLRGMVTLLLECGKIETTYTRAQEVSAKADEMITLGKKGTLAAYRDALGYITKEDVAKKVFSTLAPTYASVDGGYTQIFKMGPRRGDGAEMAIVKLVAVKAEEPVVEEAPKATKKAAKKSAPVVEETVEAPVEEAVEAPAEEVVEAPAEEAVEAPAEEAVEAPAEDNQ